MTSRRLLAESLLHHWRSHAAVLLCVLVATSVLGGALLVGDSMRGSLRDMTIDRLGRIDFALSSHRLIPSDLATRLQSALTNFADSGQSEASMLPEPALLLRGSVASVDDSNKESGRAGRVQVCGVTKTFWELCRSGTAPHWINEWDGADRRDSIVLNDQLAREIGAAVGDTVLLRVEKPSEIPREAVLGRKDDQLATLRVTVSQIVSVGEFGNFKLDSSQRAPRNAFLPLDRLADAVAHAGQANTLIVGATDRGHKSALGHSPTTPDALTILNRALSAAARLEDLGLRIRTNAADGSIAVESRRMVLEPAAATAIVLAAEQQHVTTVPTVAYLANSIRIADRGDDPPTIPYSTVAAIPLDDLVESSLRLRDGDLRGDLADDEILLNTWAADDLGCRVGDSVQLEYYVAEPTRPFETAETTFRVRGVVEIEGVAADPTLVPEYPGITDAKRYADWDPPFPMDLKRIRPKDEEYWDKYRATPKAFVSLAAAERLWGSRFGTWTSIRFRPSAGEIALESRLAPDATPRPTTRTARSLEEHLLTLLKPEQFGLAFQPVKQQGLEASAGGTDFGSLFIGFSFFLISSAAILIGLVFRLGVERRAKHVGLLLAVGFGRAAVRNLLVAEGLVVAVVGTVAGLAGAVGYAWLVMAGLRTWWFPAVGTSLLRLHVSAGTLVISAAAGLLLAALAIVLSLRGLVRLAPRALLAGATADGIGKPRESRLIVRFAVLAVGVVAVLGAFTLGGDLGDAAPVRVFILGVVALLASLSWLAIGVSGGARPLRGGGFWAIARLGVRNAQRNRTRSVLTVGLVAFATFVIVAVGANRRDDESGHSRSTDNWLVAESSVPLLYELHTPDGRRELGLPEDSYYWFSDANVYRFRVKEGEDASCLNLYQPKRPRILGVTEDTWLPDSSARFIPQSKPTQELLQSDLGADAIPAIGDANSVRWILHLGLGDRLPVIAEDGRTVKLQIVKLLDRSVFQSELLISETNFRKLFPSHVGYSFFLIEVKTKPALATDSSRLSTLLEQHLSEYGFDATPLSQRLAEYHAVENTYLATFQTLGGLGLMLGTLGLGAVVLRGVLERRAELALLTAVGYRPAALAWLVLAETGYLLIMGLATGSVSAMLAVMPHLLRHAGEVPILSLATTLLLVLAVGLMSSVGAVLATLRTPLLPALRSE